MKRFIDNKGTFEIKVPATWKYSIKDEKIHTFQEYEIWKPDTFQLSIHSLDTEEQRKRFFYLTKSINIEKIGDLDFHKFADTSGNGFTTKTWIRQFRDKAVFFTLTHSNNPDKNLENKTIEEKIAIVHFVLKNFKIVEDCNKIEVLSSYRFDMFLQGVGAAALMLSKSIENKAFIETTCILANQIDALLRIGIVLKNQINNRNSEIEVEWIYQGIRDKKKSEKDIYIKASALGIIDKPTYDELYKLYDDRNRVVHRFIISEITLAEVEEIAYRYYRKQQAIRQIIYDLESEQIKLNIGMTKIGEKQSEEKHLYYIKGKIGKENYFEEKNK